MRRRRSASAKSTRNRPRRLRRPASRTRAGTCTASPSRACASRAHAPAAVAARFHCRCRFRCRFRSGLLHAEVTFGIRALGRAPGRRLSSIRRHATVNRRGARGSPVALPPGASTRAAPRRNRRRRRRRRRCRSRRRSDPCCAKASTRPRRATHRRGAARAHPSKPGLGRLEDEQVVRREAGEQQRFFDEPVHDLREVVEAGTDQRRRQEHPVPDVVQLRAGVDLGPEMVRAEVLVDQRADLRPHGDDHHEHDDRRDHQRLGGEPVPGERDRDEYGSGDTRRRPPVRAYARVPSGSRRGERPRAHIAATSFPAG